MAQSIGLSVAEKRRGIDLVSTVPASGKLLVGGSKYWWTSTTVPNRDAKFSSLMRLGLYAYVEQQTTGDRKDCVSSSRVYVGERIDLRSFAKSPRVISQQPVTLPIDGGGIVVLYRYGAAVFFDTATADQTRFISTLVPLIEQPYERPESEEVSVCVSTDKKEGMESGITVILRDTSVERLQVVAAALGKSALAQYETDIASTFDSIEPMAVQLEKSGKVGRDARLCCATLDALFKMSTRWSHALKLSNGLMCYGIIPSLSSSTRSLKTNLS